MPKTPIFEKKNVLVTGGAGFIGSHLCEELLKTSKVICLDNFISSEEANIDHLLSNPDFAFVRHDMIEPLDLEALPELEKFKIQFQGVQEIYNLACPTSAKHFETHIIETALTNSYGVKNALDLALKYKAKFLHFSSAVVYGPRAKDKIYFKEEDSGEVDFTGPRSCYDEGKRFAETMVMTYRYKHKLNIKIARIFRTFGPREKLKDHQMIPDFIVDALDNKDLVIYGDKEFDTSLCYVTDIVDAAIKLMQNDKVKQPINLGGETTYNLTEVAQKIIEMTGSSSKVVHKKAMLFITPQGLPDITKAKEKLGWIPVVALEKGLQLTIEYTKANKALLKYKG